MGWKCYLGCIALFVFGLLTGTATAPRKSFVDGKMSACKDMMQVVVGVNPMVAMANPQCVLYKGDVAIQIGEKVYSLDGQKVLKE